MVVHGYDERPTVGDEHDWVAAAFELARDEARRYLRTLARFCVAPHRFGREWAAGSADALNPFGFLATSAALLGLVMHVWISLLGQEDETLGGELYENLRPYVLFALFGLLAHPLLRQKRLRSSMAMALYAGAGPATLSGLALLIVTFVIRCALHQESNHSVVLPHLSWTRWALLQTMMLVPLAWFWTSLIAALAGLHGLPRRRSALAVAAAQLVLAVAAGELMRHGLGGTGGAFIPSVLVTFSPLADGLPLPHLRLSY